MNMVFAIPDWEDGNVKKTTLFHEKGKGKQKNGSLNKSPQKKTKPKNVPKVKGVSEKSKLINKENKKQLRRQKQKSNNKTKNNNNIQPIVAKANTAKLENGYSKNQEILKLNTKMTIKQNNEKSKNRNSKKDNSDSSLKVENIDTDKLDEVLLNAKKKKFNEALRRDDVEDVLFKEDKSPEAIYKKPQKNEQLHQNTSTVKDIVNKSEIFNKKHPNTERKQKKLKNNLVVTAKVKNNSISKPIIDNKVLKVNDLKIHNNKLSMQTHQDKKKNKLKMILKEESNRNSINFNRNKLRERMLDRLKSAQFRFLNEKLYTSSGSEASQLFKDDPTAFQNYHEGYQQQVKKWPVNPLDVIIKRIKNMPKSHLIVDMGCGEAALAKRVPHAVRSFDLVGTAPGVEVCDMAHTPLLSASMDAVVYCLALMGTELTTYLLEANRVLKTGGHLLIAEVESRFTDVNAFTKDVTRLGFKLQKLNREHEVFFFMEFVKNQEPPVKKAKLPVLKLKPCIYKRR